MIARPKRLRLRFSIQAMLLGVAVLCWVIYQVDWITKRNEALAQPGIHSSLNTTIANRPQTVPPRAPGMLWLFGVSGVERFLIPARESSPERMAELRRLFPEAEVGSFRSMARYEEEPGRFIWDNWDLNR